MSLENWLAEMERLRALVWEKRKNAKTERERVYWSWVIRQLLEDERYVIERATR